MIIVEMISSDIVILIRQEYLVFSKENDKNYSPAFTGSSNTFINVIKKILTRRLSLVTESFPLKHAAST